MTELIGYYLFALSAILLVYMAWQHRTGRVELLSIRNIAIVGFILFQLSSAAIHLISGDYALIRLSDPQAAGAEFAIMATVFIPVSLLSYRLAPGVRSPARKLAEGKREISGSGMLGLALVLTVGALVMRFAVFIPYVAIVTNLVGVGFSAVACGLVGWTWARRFADPLMILVVLAVLVANIAIGMWGEFGRRNIVAIMGALLWGMYYSVWRHYPLKTLLVRAGLISVIPFIFLSLYTSVRSSADGGRTVIEHIQAMKDGSVITGTTQLVSGQATGAFAFWAIENFPEQYDHRHLMTVRYFLVAQVPRAWWDDKPVPLSTYVANLGNVRGVGSVTLPAGIIGNAAAEGGWYALIIYAIAAGVFLRFFDELVRCNPWSPFVVLPVGCQLGQVLGLARGETSLFANQFVIAFIGVWITMSLTGKLLDAMGVSRDADAFADAGEERNWTAYGDEAWLTAQNEQTGEHPA